MTAKFVADVGGTNIRLAKVDGDQLSHIRKYICKDYPSINHVIKLYFEEFPEHSFSAGCLGVACPVTSDHISMTNSSWQFSIKALQEDLGLESLYVINDFTAVAHAVTVLSEEQRVQVGLGQAQKGQNIAVFGPGTGLGVKHLTPSQDGWTALDGEGGHVDFAAVDDIDIQILHFLTQKFGHASAEEVLSGRGIVHIYQALSEYRGSPAHYSEASAITSAAIDGSCELCVATLNQFCKILGSFAGNLALNLGTRGGVYIGGGIASRFTDFIRKSEFRLRFEAKGRFKDYVSEIPTYIITEPDHGLIGAMAYLNQNLKGQP